MYVLSFSMLKESRLYDTGMVSLRVNVHNNDISIMQIKSLLEIERSEALTGRFDSLTSSGW